MLKDIAGIVKTETQNRKAIYKVLKMDKVPDKGKVLLAFLGHPRFTNMFKKDHPNTEVFVMENQELDWLYDEIDNVKLVDPVNIDLIKETLKDMKFDYIIMNPPYNGNLHLKILNEVMKHSNNIVNLSPIRWLQDPISHLKPGSDFNKFKNILLNIKSLSVIPMKTVEKLFNITFSTDLGIYYITKDTNIKKSFDINSTKFIYENKNIKPFIEKLLKFKTYSFADICEKNKLDGFRVKVNALSPLVANDGRTCNDNWRKWIINPHTSTYIYNNGYTKDGVFWANLSVKCKYTKKEGEPLPYSIKFNTYKEALNFENACKTNFMNACKVFIQRDVNVPLKYLPWMGNEINPRTGLKGYESEWTDEDFYKFFDLTNDEIKIIEDTMEKYK